MMKSLQHVFVLVLLGVGSSLLAQDFHYSQFYHGPMHLNPALTGIFNGDARIMGNYKSQWADVPVDYQTFTVAFDKKFLRRTDKDGFFSGGIALNYDRAGDSRLTWADVNLNVSYTAILSRSIFLTLGGQGALAQRSYDEENLRFDAQFDEPRGILDPLRPNGESFSSSSFIFPDFSIGLNLRIQAKYDPTVLVFRNKKRSKIDLGVAIHHLTNPDQSFDDDFKFPLESRLSPYAIGTLQLGKPLDLVAAVTYQTQSEAYEELVGMAGVRLHLNNNLGRQFNILLGAGLRRNEIQDSWWPTVELGINNLEIGLNYDFNTSRFSIATENQGGLELSVRYLFRKIRALPGIPNCPLI
ncbi:MAG: PorP/SprF family type IX secretion system membrane protein [Bacteroidota bacterium]